MLFNFQGPISCHLSVTALSLYHPLPSLSIPFSTLFYFLTSLPCVLWNLLNFLWKTVYIPLILSFSIIHLEISNCLIYNSQYSVCACSSVDRAPASGAGCVGSIPVRRTKNGRTYMSCRFSSIYKCIIYTMPRRQQASASYFPHCENPLETVQERKAYRTSPNIP